MNPAREIIDKFGGSGVVASITGVTPQRVLAWTYKNRPGTGGKIPWKHHRALIEAAQERGIDLSLRDFYKEPSDAGN